MLSKNICCLYNGERKISIGKNIIREWNGKGGDEHVRVHGQIQIELNWQQS